MNVEDLRRKRAELSQKLAKLDFELGNDPKQYLFAIEHAHIDLLETLEKVEYALSPDCIFDFWDENCDKKTIKDPGSIQGEAHIRCQKALEVLQEYRDNAECAKARFLGARLKD